MKTLKKQQIRMHNNLKAGFVSFGEINSPKQLIKSKCQRALEEITSLGIETVTTDVVTDDPGGQDVRRAIVDLKKEPFDVLILCLAGWIPSHTVIDITSKFKEKPMILWGLAGDMEDSHIVTTAAQAGTTALRKVFDDLGYSYKFIYNIIGRLSPLDKINDFVSAATASASLEGAKVGMMGFRDMNLYDTLYEGMSLKKSLGIDVEFFEMLEMVQSSKKIEDGQVEEVLNTIKQEWDFVKPIDDEFLRKGITYYLAIKEIAEANHFDAISLKDVDGMKKILHFPPAMIFMLLADEMNLCTIPENDVMGAVTQLVVKYITGQCAAYFEFYEFFEHSVLVGVPDYVPAEVVDGKVKITRAAFGGISGGLLNISKVKTGRLTMARLSNTGDQYIMHLCTGEGKLRSWEEAGWDQPAPQLPSLEIVLDSPVEDFARKVSSQHCLIAYGDHTQALTDFCYLKNIEVV
jgi:L-fucose isomerase-like protein